MNCRKMFCQVLILVVICVFQRSEGKTQMKKYVTIRCSTSSWSPSQTYENVPSTTVCIALCRFALACSAIKFDHFTNSCEIGGTVGLDTNITGFPLIDTVDILYDIEGGVGRVKLLTLNGAKGPPPELVDLSMIPNRCRSVPSYPLSVSSSGAVSTPMGFPLVCGGYPVTVNCYYLANNEWVLHSKMNIARNMFSLTSNSFVSNLLFAALGANDVNGATIEFFKNDISSWVSANVSYPYIIRGSCSRFINSTTVFSTGGYAGYISPPSHLKETFFIDMDSVVPGPAMKIARDMHGCSRILRDSTSSDYVLIVAGGFIDIVNPTDSVEIFDPITGQWWEGPTLPYSVAASGMTEDTLGGVLIAGGQTNDKPLGVPYILHLPHAGPDATWTVLPQMFSGPYNKNSLVAVNDSLGYC